MRPVTLTSARRQRDRGEPASRNPVSAAVTTPSCRAATWACKKAAIRCVITPCSNPAGDIITSAPRTSSQGPMSPAAIRSSAVARPVAARASNLDGSANPDAMAEGASSGERDARLDLKIIRQPLSQDKNIYGRIVFVKASRSPTCTALLQGLLCSRQGAPIGMPGRAASFPMSIRPRDVFPCRLIYKLLWHLARGL